MTTTYWQVHITADAAHLDEIARGMFPRKRSTETRMAALAKHLDTNLVRGWYYTVKAESEGSAIFAASGHFQEQVKLINVHRCTFTAKQLESGMDRARRKITEITVDADKAVKKFAKELLESEAPSRVMSWSKSAIASSCLRDVAIEVSAVMEEQGLDKTMAWLKERILRQSRHPSFSTSPTSNLVDQFTVQAQAELLESLEWESHTDEYLAKEAIN